MENNLENKAKFFAQHYGQKVYRHNAWNSCRESIEVHGSSISNCAFGYLELYPLSSISDKDRIEINRIEGLPDYENEEAYLILGSDWDFCGYRNGKFYRFLLIESYQYLQSKGYALPFMGVTVEKLIEYGWVKLKDNA